MMKNLLRIGLALGAAASLSATEIHIAIPKPPSYYNPRQVGDSVTHGVLSQVYETPLLFTSTSPNGEPNLFSSVKTADNLSYVAALKPGIVFSDGAPLTAAAVITWLSAVHDVSSRATMTAGRSGSTETVTFRLKEPDKYFASLLMMNYAAIARETSKGTFVGTGPFVLGRHDDREIILEKNPRFRDAASTKVDRLVFRVYPAEPDGTNPKLIEAIKKGEVDFTDALPLSALPQLQSMSSIRTIVLESKNTGWLSFNLRRAPFDNVRLRQAIALMIDPAPIVQSLYPVGTRPTASILPPSLAQQVPGVDFDIRATGNAAQGKRELSALGYTPEKKLKISLVILWASRPYCSNPVRFGALVKEQIESSGLVSVKVIEPASGDQYFQALLQGHFDMAGNGWIADGPNPADFVEANFSSDKIGCLSNCNNMPGWKNANADKAIREIRTTGSASAYKALMDQIRADLPIVPIVHGPSVIALSRRLHGVEPSTFSYLWFRSASLTGP